MDSACLLGLWVIFGLFQVFDLGYRAVSRAFSHGWDFLPSDLDIRLLKCVSCAAYKGNLLTCYPHRCADNFPEKKLVKFTGGEGTQRGRMDSWISMGQS